MNFGRVFLILIGTLLIANTVALSELKAGDFTRELSTDRPDKTESPYTVEPGRFQFELDLFNYDHDKIDKLTTSKTYATNANAKIGLTSNVDLQIVFGYEHNEIETESDAMLHASTLNGLGDPVLRIKINLLGNDGGPIAIAAMPYASLPVGTDEVSLNEWEGGLILPVAVALPYDLGLGLMYELDVLYGDNGKHVFGSITSITIGRDLTDQVGAFVELFQSSSGEGANTSWSPSLDMGVTIGMITNWQLDAGINIGLNNQISDYNPFLGLSFRL